MTVDSVRENLLRVKKTIVPYTPNIIAVMQLQARLIVMQMQRVRHLQHVVVDIQLVQLLAIVQQQVQHGIPTILRQPLHVQEVDVLIQKQSPLQH